MKRIVLLLCVFALGCPTATEKSNNTVVINNGNNQNNVGDGGNNQNNVSDVSVSVDFGTDPDGPQFVDVSVAPARITEGQLFTVLVQVTDPQGFGDIGGGVLTTLDGTAIGNFIGSGGTYSIDVSWSDVNAAQSLTFTDEESRTFIAEFFDAGQHVSRAPVDVAFHCDGEPACDGICGDELCDGECRGVFDDDLNCGSCDNPCQNGESCFDQQCRLANFLNLCDRETDCIAPVGTDTICANIFGGGDRCVTLCTVDGNECGADQCVNVGDPNDPVLICLQDCSNDPGRCVDQLACQDVGQAVSVCAPPMM